MKRLILFLLVVGMGFGQSTPTTSVYQQLLSDVETVPAQTAVVRNIGQIAHSFLLSWEDNAPNVCVNPNSFNQVLVDASYDGTTFFVLTTYSLMPQSGIIRDVPNGTIYQYINGMAAYPYIRMRILNFDTVNCQLDVFYTGSSNITEAPPRRKRFRTSGGIDRYADEMVSYVLSWDNNMTMQAGATYTYNGDSALDVGRGAWDRLLDCAHSVVVDVGAAATIEIVGLVADQTIHVCSVDISLAAAGTFQLVTGTGANCAVGAANLTGVITLAQGVPLSLGGNLGRLFNSPDAEALCVTTTGGGATAQGVITYAQYDTDQTPG